MDRKKLSLILKTFTLGLVLGGAIIISFQYLFSLKTQALISAYAFGWVVGDISFAIAKRVFKLKKDEAKT